MAKLPRINLTVEQIAAIEDDLFAYYKEPIMPKSLPCVAPMHMEVRIIDDEQEYDCNGSPIYRGYHPKYPTGTKWFSCDWGGRGTVLKVRGVKLYVEIMDIVAEENDSGAWQWSIKLVKHIREVK